MRKVCTLTAILVFASALAYAETWTGKLFDANCVEQQEKERKTETCTPTSGTSSFAIQASGKMLKLDADGNRKAAEAWREYNNSADRAKDPEMKDDRVTATVEGTLSGDEIKVEAIQIR